MALGQTLTLREAGYVLDRSTVTINKAVDSGIIRARQRRVGKAVQRLFGPAELRFLRLSDELDKDLTPAGRRRLYEAIRKLSTDSHHITLGKLVLDLSPIDEDLELRMSRLEGIRKWIEQPEGRTDAVLVGTDIPAHQIAALARGQSIAEILEDYPSLTKAQVEASIEYAKAYPKRGRPYPARSLKRMLADLAELGGFDDSDEPIDAMPREIP
jgi:uncharacterized protein (DUF433 family)